MTQTEPQERAFDPGAEAKRLLRVIRSGALATLYSASGHPFATLVNVATDSDGTPLLLMSRLAAHSRNLAADPRCSLLLAESGKGDPLAHPRLTLVGVAEPAQGPGVRARFLRRHPKASLYAGFSDFGFYRLKIDFGHLNGGFGRAAQLDAPQLLTEVADAADLLAAEEEVIADLNEHQANEIAHIARSRGATGGAWRVTGVDPEGLDLLGTDEAVRISLPERVIDRPGLAAMLQLLAGAPLP